MKQATNSLLFDPEDRGYTFLWNFGCHWKEATLLSLEREVGWAPELARMRWKREKISFPCRESNPIRPRASLVTVRLPHCPRYIAFSQTPKKTLPRIRSHRKQFSHCCSSHCCVRVRCQATVVNNVSNVDCWPTACTSHYIFLIYSAIF
jgi:hypothetical protein